MSRPFTDAYYASMARSVVTKRVYADGTWLATQGPWSIYVDGMVLCPDGSKRRITRIREADVWFGFPATVRAHGKRVTGTVYVESRDGYETATTDDPPVVKFNPYRYGKNWRMVMTPHQVNEAEDFDPGGTRYDPAFIEFDMPVDGAVAS